MVGNLLLNRGSGKLFEPSSFIKSRDNLVKQGPVEFVKRIVLHSVRLKPDTLFTNIIGDYAQVRSWAGKHFQDLNIALLEILAEVIKRLTPWKIHPHLLFILLFVKNSCDLLGEFLKIK